MNNNLYRQTDNRRTVVGSAVIGIGLCIGLILIGILISKLTLQPDRADQAAKLGIVPYIEPTATLAATLTPVVPTIEVIDGIQKGSVVQIFGTEGVGLKIRTDPGIQSVQKFIALDSEIYQISDGPIRMNDYIWWQLTSAYDPDRSGWAVSQYLTRIQ